MNYGPEPIDLNEPEAVRLRKAGEGAFWHALRSVWTDEQIFNSLRTYRESVRHEAAEEIMTHHDDTEGLNSKVMDGLQLAADLIDPQNQ